MEQNQNKNRQLQLQEAIPPEAQQVSQPPIPGASPSAPAETNRKHQHDLQPRISNLNSKQTSTEIDKHPHHVTHKELMVVTKNKTNEEYQ